MSKTWTISEGHIDRKQSEDVMTWCMAQMVTGLLTRGIQLDLDLGGEAT